MKMECKNFSNKDAIFTNKYGISTTVHTGSFEKGKSQKKTEQRKKVGLKPHHECLTAVESCGVRHLKLGMERVKA